MKPWRTWLTCLGVIGALATIGGCGSGDVPDPGSDDQAASAPTEGSGPPQPAAQAPAPGAKVADADAKAEEAKGDEPAAQAEAPPSAQGQAGGGTAQGDRNSATAEMLAEATKGRSAPPAGGAPGDAPAPGSSPPPGGGGLPGGGMGAPPGGAPGMGPPGGGGMAGGMASQMQGQQQQAMAKMQEQMKNQMGRQGMAMGMPGPGGGMGGGPGAAQEKAPDFRSPQGAVQAFLDAVKAKDLGRVTDATALHAGREDETSNHYQETFRRIIEGTLSESELTKLAGNLEDYKITGLDQAKTSGRQKVILSKRGTGSHITWTYQIVITARREKKGWGVCDISGVGVLKSPRMSPMRGQQPKRT
jgi:hypothetical protein